MPDNLNPSELEFMAGKAFGSGAHESTQATLIALQAIAKQGNFPRILDMGCGSGILSLVAGRVWKEAAIIATDILPEAVAATQQNAEANQVPLEALQSDGFKHPRIREVAPYDLIICNMVAEAIIMLARDMQHYTSPQGRLILSGILHWLLPQVIAAYEYAGFAVVEVFAVKDWRAVVMGRI